MFQKISAPLWMLLPKEEREHLVKVFHLTKTGPVEVYNEMVKADGYSDGDLSVITKESMSAYTGSPVDMPFHRLWEVTLSKCNYELHPPMEIKIPVAEPTVIPEPTVVATKQRGRPKKVVTPKNDETF